MKLWSSKNEKTENINTGRWEQAGKRTNYKDRDHLEELVKKRTSEFEEKNKKLEKFNDLFVDREFRIKELKDKVKKLEKKR